MTTDNNQQVADTVSAEDEQIAGQITQTDEAQDKTETTPVEVSKPLTLADLEALERRLQGRNANWNADQMKRLREELKAEIAPVRDFISRSEEQRVDQLEPEEQAAYWRKKAEEAAKPQPEPERAQARDRQTALLSEAEQQTVVFGMKSFLEGVGADPEMVKNAALWQGWESIDDPTAALKLAQANYRRITASNGARAVAPKPAAVRAAPSTTGAPKASASEFRSYTEILEALSDPDDMRVKNTDDIRKERARLKDR